MVFENRIEAAKALIPYLERFRKDDVVVLAIPRGGVPMGYVIANYFGWPLSLLLTKKIGHPMNKEYAIGAVSLDSIIVDQGHPEVPKNYISEESERIRKLLRQRYEKFMGSGKIEPVQGRVVVIIDDGIATGYTMKASIEMLKKLEPSKIVIAVPVAPPRMVNLLRALVDDIIVLDTPADFRGVGQFYADFSEVTDDDVLEILNRVKV